MKTLTTNRDRTLSLIFKVQCLWYNLDWHYSSQLDGFSLHNQCFQRVLSNTEFFRNRLYVNCCRDRNKLRDSPITKQIQSTSF